MKKSLLVILCVWISVIAIIKTSISYSSDEIVEFICPNGVATRVIIYNTNGGNSLDSQYISAIKYSDTSLPIPVKSGYIFKGWYYDSTLTNKVNTNDFTEVSYTPKYDTHGCVQTVSVNLYAKWEEVIDAPSIECVEGISPYKIVFNSNGGTNINDFIHCGDCTYKDKPLILSPYKSGYSFDGWYYDSELKNKVSTKYSTDIKYSPLKDSNGCVKQAVVNLYAKWEKNEEESNNVSDDSVLPGDNSNNITPPVLEDNSDNTIKCTNKEKNYQVIFNTNEGDVIRSILVCDDCEVTDKIIPIPEKIGYVFDGWYYDIELTNRINTDDVFKLDYEQLFDDNECAQFVTVNLYAKWNKLEENDEPISSKKIIIFYDSKGGSIVVPDILYSGSIGNTSIVVPTREGYIFSGWYYDEKYTMKVNVEYVEQIHNEASNNGFNDSVTLYAKWEEEKNTFNFNVKSVLFVFIGMLVILVIVVSFANSRKTNYYEQL